MNHHQREWITIKREWVIVLKSQVSNLSAIWQREVTVQWDAIDVIFVLDRHAYWIFIVLAHWTNSSHVDMSIYSDTLSSFLANQLLLLLLLKQQIPMLYSLIWLICDSNPWSPTVKVDKRFDSQGAQNPRSTTLTITPPMIYHTQGEHPNHYTTNDLPQSRWAPYPLHHQCSTTLKVSTLTITPPMIYHTQGEHPTHYITNDLPHSRWAL